MLCDDLVVLKGGQSSKPARPRRSSPPHAEYTRELLAAIPYFEPNRVPEPAL